MYYCDGSDPEEEPQDYQPAPTGNQPTPSALRIQVPQSPFLDTFYGHSLVHITINSGATGNMIRLSTVQKLKVEICKSAQSAHQADGSSPLKVIGETKLSFTHRQHVFQFDRLVMENLDVEVLTGTPFMEANDIAVHPAKHLITLPDGSSFTYGSSDDHSTQQASRRAVVLRAPTTSTTLWHGDYIELELPQDLPPDSLHALEPCSNISLVHLATTSDLWPPPGIISNGQEEYESQTCKANPFSLNDTSTFVRLASFSPLVLMNSLNTPPTSLSSQSACRLLYLVLASHQLSTLTQTISCSPICSRHFTPSLTHFDSVFDPTIQGYNGAVGPFEARVNMGPVEPPQRKGHLPQYARSKLVDLQNKFDELEKLGIFKWPEDLNVAVEYLKPSFLVKKSNSG